MEMGTGIEMTLKIMMTSRRSRREEGKRTNVPLKLKATTGNGGYGNGGEKSAKTHFV